MATEVSRKSYGMTGKGPVTLIVFNNTDDVGEDVLRYQVRHGVRTVVDTSSQKAAESLARSLVEAVD